MRSSDAAYGWMLAVALAAILGVFNACALRAALGSEVTRDHRTVLAGHTHSIHDLRAKGRVVKGVRYPSRPYPCDWHDRAIPLLDIIAALSGVLDMHYGPEYEVTVEISSGYRYPALNKAVGGVPRSQHKEGRAADLRAWVRRRGAKKRRRVPVRVWREAVRKVHPHMPIGGVGYYWGRGFIHVDTRPIPPSGRPARWGVSKS